MFSLIMKEVKIIRRIRNGSGADLIVLIEGEKQPITIHHCHHYNCFHFLGRKFEPWAYWGTIEKGYANIIEYKMAFIAEKQNGKHYIFYKRSLG